MFADDLTAGYLGWCDEALDDHVKEACSPLDTADEQHQCGRRITSEYASYTLRFGINACSGITDRSAKDECFAEDFELYEAVLEAFDATWAKVREGGNSDPLVQAALAETLACLEAQGHGDPHPDLFLFWQRHDEPFDVLFEREEQMTGEERRLREALTQATMDCTTDTGLFVEQDRAWAAELRRLQEDEPELVADLIREGVLTAFERPGVTTFLLPNLLPHQVDSN